MKNLLAVILIILLSISLLFSQNSEREIFRFTYSGKDYEVVKIMMNWTAAAAFAVERNGYLVEINDLEEQLAIHDAIVNGAQVSTDYTSISNGGGIAYVWIGATDQNEEGSWLWDGNNDHVGTGFWTGQGANGNNSGAAVNGAYYNWGGTNTGIPKEPDNWGNAQHYAAIGLTG
ncbi:MAG: C-type lectin domain-containing protein [Candidatus Cloacimonetes bacterium]|nr:C-type lectin domain-containing protein [Candidatus Cloacimonadota bacterium]